MEVAVVKHLYSMMELIALYVMLQIILMYQAKHVLIAQYLIYLQVLLTKLTTDAFACLMLVLPVILAHVIKGLLIAL